MLQLQKTIWQMGDTEKPLKFLTDWSKDMDFKVVLTDKATGRSLS